MDTLDVAIHSTAHDAAGGLPALARKMGVHEQVLRNKVCPTTDTHKLILREALAMMELTGDDRILFVMAELRGYVVSRKELPDAKSLVTAVLEANAEEGDVAKSILAAIADGKLTVGEKADIAEHIRMVQNTLDTLNATVQHSPTLINKDAA